MHIAWRAQKRSLVVWYQIRNTVRSWSILIIVLSMHGLLIYLLLIELTSERNAAMPHERIVESAPVYFTPHTQTPAAQPQQPMPITQDEQSQNQRDQNNPEPQPQQPEPSQPKDEMLFASLYQKAPEPEETETVDASDQDLPEPEPEKTESPIIDPLTLRHEEKKKEKPLTPNTIAPKKVAKAPADVATDDIPMAFEGVHTTQLSERDSLFHTFIKAVNTALYTAIKEGTPPFTPGIQPIVIRLIIVRTGRLAQRPTVVRSSGNPSRDNWYIDAVVRGSASFPPIPDGLKLPFAEMYFKEGSKGIRP